MMEQKIASAEHAGIAITVTTDVEVDYDKLGEYLARQDSVAQAAVLWGMFSQLPSGAPASRQALYISDAVAAMGLLVGDHSDFAEWLRTIADAVDHTP